MHHGKTDTRVLRKRVAPLLHFKFLTLVPMHITNSRMSRMAAGKPGRRLLNLRAGVVGHKPTGSCGSWELGSDLESFLRERQQSLLMDWIWCTHENWSKGLLPRCELKKLIGYYYLCRFYNHPPILNIQIVSRTFDFLRQWCNKYLYTFIFKN